MTELDKAYLAGLFDGEGSVHLGYYRHQKSSKLYPRLTISIGNNVRSVLDWVRVIMGVGGVYSCRSARGNCQEQFKWQATCAGARLFLREVLPYLKIKQDKAARLLAEEAALVRPNKRGDVAQVGRAPDS